MLEHQPSGTAPHDFTDTKHAYTQPHTHPEHTLRINPKDIAPHANENSNLRKNSNYDILRLRIQAVHTDNIKHHNQKPTTTEYTYNTHTQKPSTKDNHMKIHNSRNNTSNNNTSTYEEPTKQEKNADATKKT